MSLDSPSPACASRVLPRTPARRRRRCRPRRRVLLVSRDRAMWHVPFAPKQGKRRAAHDVLVRGASHLDDGKCEARVQRQIANAERQLHPLEPLEAVAERVV